jgi:hypothetical protein
MRSRRFTMVRNGKGKGRPEPNASNSLRALGDTGNGGKNRHTLNVRISTACAPPNMAAVVIP